MVARRIVVLGGTGIFGRRLARHLLGFENIELILTSRSRSAAETAASELGTTKIPVTGEALDTRSGFTEGLRNLKPWAVIDCSGPFQNSNHDISKTILSAGAHAIDIGDARDYLLGYSAALDETARAHSVTGLAGASSTPALSSAVVDKLTKDWAQVDAIDICITPGGKSEVGRSVIEAIMSYAGLEISVWRNGRIEAAEGWIGSRVVIMPGLGKRRVAPVETADSNILGPKHAVRLRVTFSAGLESSLEQWGMEVLARLRRAGIINNLSPLIPLLLALRRATRLITSDEGGMLVELKGVDADGIPVKRNWSLLAKQDHGPFVPVMAAAAALRLLLAGKVESGARLAAQELTLTDIEAEWQPYDITSTIQDG